MFSSTSFLPSQLYEFSCFAYIGGGPSPVPGPSPGSQAVLHLCSGRDRRDGLCIDCGPHAQPPTPRSDGRPEESLDGVASHVVLNATLLFVSFAELAVRPAISGTERTNRTPISTDPPHQCMGQHTDQPRSAYKLYACTNVNTPTAVVFVT